MSEHTNKADARSAFVAISEIIAVLWRAKTRVLAGGIIGFAIGVAIGLMSTPRFRATTLLGAAPTPTAGRSLAGLAGQLGGLAELAGIQMGGGQDLDQSLAVVQSEEFLERFIDEEHLLPLIFDKQWDSALGVWNVDSPGPFRRLVWQLDGTTGKRTSAELGPSLWDGFKILTQRLEVRKDRVTQVVSLSVDWKDPEIAARIANRLPMRLNEQARRRTIAESERSLKYVNEQLAVTTVFGIREALFRLAEGEQRKAMIAQVGGDIAVRVLASAVPPSERSAPKRTLLALGGALLGTIVASIFVIARRLSRRIPSEPSNVE